MNRTRERIDLSLIDDNPWQPRSAMDPEALDGLAENIHQLGLLQPPLLRPVVGGRYQAAFGHRRIAALRLLHQQGRGESFIDMDVADPDYLTDARMALMALSENERRQELTQIEVLRAHKKAIEETDLTVTSLADELGIARPTLANNLRVLELPDFILEHVESGACPIGVAREFLVFRSPTHEHTEDMRRVVHWITGLDDSPPDWRRKNVRKLIAERVSGNEADWRPLGPKTEHSTAGGNREATFDVGEFEFEFRDCLHTIPADDGSYDRKNYRRHDLYDQSRVWTCEVKEWSRRQSRATREANKEAAESGASPSAGKASPQGNPTSDGGRAKRFEALIAADPVWLAMPARRDKPGPRGWLSDYEKEQMGTRAEFVKIENGGDRAFWKLVQQGTVEEPYRWRSGSGKHMPPWFPIEDCRTCVAGAAYAYSPQGYPLDKPALVCTNADCYSRKNESGMNAFREKLDARRVGINNVDLEATSRLALALWQVPEGALQAMTVALAAAGPSLEFEHPIGDIFDSTWSYESETVARIKEIIGPKAADKAPDYRRRDAVLIKPEAIDAPANVHEARELAARLMVYHLRKTGQLGIVSWETDEAHPAEDEPAEVGFDTLEDAVSSALEAAGPEEYLTFGNVKAALPVCWRGEHSSKWLPAIRAVAPDAYSKKVKVEGKVVVAAFGVRLKSQARF